VRVPRCAPAGGEEWGNLRDEGRLGPGRDAEAGDSPGPQEEIGLRPSGPPKDVPSAPPEIVEGVRRLDLQSIMSDTRQHSCMINSIALREGQQINGFTIEKIAGSTVIVRHGIYRFELKMPR
jgi:hypothetical protein